MFKLVLFVIKNVSCYFCLQLEEFSKRERIESFSSIISKRTTFMSVNEAPSFTSIPELIEESEVWVRGPMSKLPPLSDPVPSDWEVIEGYYCYH